jgi:hypothetical protein
MYDVNKIGIATMGGDRHMVTVIGGFMVLENITGAEGARLGIPIFGSDFWDPHW